MSLKQFIMFLFLPETMWGYRISDTEEMPESLQPMEHWEPLKPVRINKLKVGDKLEWSGTSWVNGADNT